MIDVPSDALQPFAFTHCGWLLNYVVIGILSGIMRSASYPLFSGYLNVPGSIYVAATSLVNLPWSFQVVYGTLSDFVPLAPHHRRIPFLALGWCICTLALLLLFLTPQPPPYWCLQLGLPAHDAPPCNPSAPSHAATFARLMMLATLGFCVVHIPLDALTAELSQREPLSERGRTMYRLRDRTPSLLSLL